MAGAHDRVGVDREPYCWTRLAQWTGASTHVAAEQEADLTHRPNPSPHLTATGEIRLVTSTATMLGWGDGLAYADASTRTTAKPVKAQPELALL